MEIYKLILKKKKNQIMFNTLFGAKQKPKAPPVVNVENTTENLQSKVEDIDMRLKKVENDIAKCKAEALVKAKNKDQRGALRLLR